MKKIGYLILIFSAIILLSFITRERFQKLKESLKEGVSLPKVEIPKIEIPIEQKKGEKEFVTPDGKLKIKYPDDWVEGNEQLLKALNQETIGLEKKEIVFFASKFSLASAFPSYLSLKISSQSTFEEIISEIEKNLKEREGEIIKLEKKEDEILVEAKYKNQVKSLTYLYYLKGKIILTPEKSYLILIFVPETDFPKLTPEIDFILNSIEIIK